MEQEWIVKGTSTEHGPFSAGEMKQFANTGRIAPETLVRRGAGGTWTPAANVKGLFDEGVNQQSMPVQAVPPSPLDEPTQPADAVAGRPFSQGKRLAIGVGSAIGTALLVIVIGLILLARRDGGSTQTTTGLSLVAAVLPERTETSGVQPAALTTEQVVAQTEPSVAFIKARFSSGTGFIVRPGIVATNKHVIEGELIDHIKVHFPSAAADARGPFSAELLYKDPERDLAFLSVSTSLPALKLAPQHAFRRGQEVIVIGNPGVSKELVLQNAISRGVMSTQAEIKGQEYYQLGISINSGNSGGPVLDSAGQVIGVVTLKATEQEGLGFCIPLPQLNAAMESLEKLSLQEIAVIRSQHRLLVVFAFVGLSGEVYKSGMQAYTSAMEWALKSGASANVGLQAVRDAVEGKVSPIAQMLIDDLQREVSKITIDPNIPEDTRQRFGDLWTNYLELKSYVDDPRGDLDSYKAKYNELSDNHDRLTHSLKQLLGVEIAIRLPWRRPANEGRKQRHP